MVYSTRQHDTISISRLNAHTSPKRLDRDRELLVPNPPVGVHSPGPTSGYHPLNYATEVRIEALRHTNMNPCYRLCEC